MTKDTTKQHKPEYVDSIWFIGGSPGGKGEDFLATIAKRDGCWEMEYRFRYHNSPDPWDQKDRKSWYKMRCPDDSPEALSRCRQAIDEVLRPSLETRYGDKLEVVEMQCMNSDPKFFFELSSRPWANVKQLTPEQAKQYQ